MEIKPGGGRRTLSARLMLRALYRLVLIAFYPISRLIPRDGSLVCFGWRTRDNQQYLMVALNAEHPDLRCVAICASATEAGLLRAEGLEAYARWSLAGMWNSVRAGWHVFSWGSHDVNAFLSGGAVRVNLWHGVPLKRIERDETRTGPGTLFSNTDFLSAAVLRVAEFHRFLPIHYAIAPSEAIAQRMSSALGVDLGRVLRCGNPRTDAVAYGHALPHEPSLPALLKRIHSSSRVILYCPTFRDGALGSDRHVRAFSDALLHFPVGEAPLVILRRHPWDQRTCPPPRDGSTKLLIDGESLRDIYQLLPHIDLLVTDYSSTFIDALFFRKPAVFFRPDHHEYATACRSLYADPSAKVIPTAFDAETLSQLITEALQDGFSEKMHDLRRFYWGDEIDSISFLARFFEKSRTK